MGKTGRLKLNISPDIVEACEKNDGKNCVSFGGSFHASDGTVVSKTGIDSNKAILTLKSEDLEMQAVIGQGSSGCVRKARLKPSGKTVALKEIKLTNHHLDEIGKELATLYKSSEPKGKLSPYVIEFYGAYVEEGSAYIALEYMDGSLLDMVNPSGEDMASRGVPEDVLAPITKMVLKGLQYLHTTRHLVHRDLKPSNLLYSNDGMIKITDFGVCQQLESTRGGAVTFVGTVTYMSPERLEGKTYVSNVDIWGLGISLVELLTGQHPFADVLGDAAHDGNKKFWKLLEHLGDKGAKEVVRLPEGAEISDDFRDFINQCLTKEPSARTSAEALLQHPWITENTADDAEDLKDMTRVADWLSQRRAEKSQSPNSGLTEEQLQAQLEALASF